MVSTEKRFNREYVNLESRQLVWLKSNSKEETSFTNTEVSSDELRRIIDYTRYFYNVEECFDYIKKTQNCMTLLVSTDESILNVISNIQHLKNLQGVYVLCENIRDIPRIVRPYTNLDELLKDLRIVANDKLNPPDFTTDDLNRSWWTNFIDVLCYITYPTDSLTKLVTSLKEYYSGNTSETEKLTQFELEYIPNDAIKWYTKDTCIYRVLNKALRHHDIELLFLFGFYVQDLYRQLTNEHEQFQKLSERDNFKTITYRSQLISKNEIELLENRIGLDIVTNSLLSTTLDRASALFLLGSPSSPGPDNDLHSVLFEIQADVRTMSRPYADVSGLSHFPDESEVLFAIGTEFQITDVNFTKSIWMVDLRLNNNSIKYDKDLNRLTAKRSLITCIRKFVYDYRVPSLDEKESIFNGLQRFYPLEKWILAVKYHCLAEYQIGITKDFETGMTTYKKAMNTWLEYDPDNNTEVNCWLHIGYICSSVAFNCYETTKDEALTKNIYMMALNYYEKAMTLEIVDDFERIDILACLATTYRYIGKVCNGNDEKLQTYLRAVEYRKRCLNSMLKCYSPTHIKFATYYKGSADLYKTIEDYNNAVDNYIKALDIQLQTIGSDYFRIIDLCEDIIEVDLMLDRHYERQLKYQLIKHDYILKDNSENLECSRMLFSQDKLRGSHAALANIYMKLGEIELGRNHHEQAINLEDEDASKIL